MLLVVDMTSVFVFFSGYSPTTVRPYDCRRSTFGCCADGYTPAVDAARSNCPGKIKETGAFDRYFCDLLQLLFAFSANLFPSGKGSTLKGKIGSKLFPF